jgi:hypothetical protein
MPVIFWKKTLVSGADLGTIPVSWSPHFLVEVRFAVIEPVSWCFKKSPVL